ncbi:PAAR domain-containing protein [Pseudomonas abietaniphila]|uniref:PAAR motif-containing protein n=1 Tax=Pseudomonas abietaniphila TaxID=89065 RepID=A0A1G7ZQW9_9PSED|nr:PAAR domain-containing protein [Pseudomonas abietaniphila]SDH11045.1 PAAR motif-containing protein [Pseudomonas abietaniphila]
MDAQAAARLGDEIAHGFGAGAMIGGAVAGAFIGAAVVAATVATGGVALAIMAGSIAAGGLSTAQIVKGLSTIFNLPEPTTGTLIRGSLDVYINSRNAMRADEDASSSCSGLPLSHPYWPFPVLIAEGSATVYINGKPAARLHSKMTCGAHIKSGSENTFIGGPTVSVAFVLDIEGWMHTGLEALGLLAAGGALVLAAMSGAAALAGFVVIGGAVLGGMALLGDLGDRLGPGYRDLLQGVAGMALLGIGQKLAREPATAEQRIILARQRQSQMLKDNTGFNVSPISWDRYSTIGRNGSYISDNKGISDVIGDFSGTSKMTISAQKAAELENAFGLEKGSLQNGFKIRQVANILDRMPRSPMEGNQYFLGPGKHLPGGAPEMVVESLPTTDMDGIKTLTEVFVQ